MTRGGRRGAGRSSHSPTPGARVFNFLPVRCAGAAALLAGLCLAAGCSRPVGSVTGKITYKDKSLKGGGVVFISSDGGASVSAGINEDGTYTIPRIAAGDYTVCVDTSSLKPPATGGPMMSPGMPGGKGGPPPAAKGPPPKGSGPPPGAVVPEGYVGSSPADAALASNAKKYVAIPDQYKEPGTSGLTFKADGTAQTHNIELK